MAAPFTRIWLVLHVVTALLFAVASSPGWGVQALNIGRDPQNLKVATSLEKRAPPKIPNNRPTKLFSDKQLEWIYEICQSIAEDVKEHDMVFFVGNSGGYFAYCFDFHGPNARVPNMFPIPMSKTKWYKNQEANGEERALATPKSDGLKNFYKEVLQKKIEGRGINRFILVDHSGSGRSVDGARRAIIDSIKAAGVKEYKQFSKIEWNLMNIVDNLRRAPTEEDPNPPNPFKEPKKVKLLWWMSVGEDGDVNRLVGDEKNHDRCQAEYYPRRWDRSVKEIWDKTGGFKQAGDMRTQIRNYVKERNNGQLLVSAFMLNT